MRCLQCACLVLIAVVPAGRSLSAAEPRASETVIETTTGERLVGRVLAEDAHSVRFASAALGVLTIDRSAIASMETEAAAPEEEEHAGGFASAPTGSAAAEAAAEAARKPEPKEGLLRRWLHLPGKLTASVAAGGSARTGVIDTHGYTLSLNLGYDSEPNLYNAAFQYEYSKAGGLVAADDFYFDQLYQRNLTPRFFLLAGGRYRQDSVMDIRRELNVFAGPGVYLVKSRKFDLGVAAGPSELVQTYRAAAPGLPAPPTTYNLGAAFYQFLVFRPLPDVEIAQNNLYTPSVQHSGKYIYRFMTSATIPLTVRLSIVEQFIHIYDSQPAASIKGTQNTFTSQMSYSF